MKSFKNIISFTALILVSSASFAQSITATSTTLDAAEAKISAKAAAVGASYKITEATFNNGVHMTAELTK